MSADSPQGLASCHFLASTGVNLGEEQQAGTKKGRPPDSPSPKGMTVLARKVRFIDGKPSSALPKIGTDQSSIPTGMDKDFEDGRQYGQVRLLQRLGGSPKCVQMKVACWNVKGLNMHTR